MTSVFALAIALFLLVNLMVAALVVKVPVEKDRPAA